MITKASTITIKATTEVASQFTISSPEALVWIILLLPFLTALSFMMPFPLWIIVETAIDDPTGVNIMTAVSVGLIWVVVMVVTIVCFWNLPRDDKKEKEARERDEDLEMGKDWNQDVEKTAGDRSEMLNSLECVE